MPDLIGKGKEIPEAVEWIQPKLLFVWQMLLNILRFSSPCRRHRDTETRVTECVIASARPHTSTRRMTSFPTVDPGNAQASVPDLFR
ncbi:hypothetical protein chiPu_0023598 [Chiloscyllium punctatum]|uniref:Uncharacterized protein n=1 Tax=Chiloscyllium punctatum TaxID=137246 RepID=A0A401TBH0_CHIPU|nr:hypothetical protein [Chiloscyllium punctatum]